MSHTCTIEVKLNDVDLLRKACEKLRYEFDKKKQSVKFFSSKEEGMRVDIPGWKYPVVIDEKGHVRYDNYNGEWGDIEKLNELQAQYGIEKTKKILYRKGYQFREERKNGKIRLRAFQ